MVSESWLASVMVDHKRSYAKAFSLSCASTRRENMEYKYMTWYVSATAERGGGEYAIDYSDVF